MKLAIVIVTYNGKEYLGPLFASLEEHTRLGDLALVVVDNASTDGTLQELQRVTSRFAQCHLLPQRENTGFARGNNIGLQKARELGVSYALLLNQDIEVTAGWLPPLLAALEERADVAAVQPLISLHDRPQRLNSAGNELHFCGFGYCGGYGKQLDEFAGRQAAFSVAFASGAALLLRMDALDRVGGFDETLFMYLEDADLQVQLRQLGYDCRVVPQSQVMHKYTAQWPARKYALLDRNRWIVLLKDWPRRRLVAAAPALLGVEVAVLVFALRQGWFRAKLGTYWEIARLLPAVARSRRAVQQRRCRTATDGAYLTGVMQFEGLDHPIVTRVANPLLSAYWSLIRRLPGVG